MLIPSSDYREYLKLEFERRCEVEASYSLRSFARDLDLSPSRLTEILQGKQGLSKEAAGRIADLIGLKKSEKNIFCDLVEAEHGRSAQSREAAKRRLKSNITDLQFGPLREDLLQSFADWHHFAILHLLDLPQQSQDPEALARRLGISVQQVVSSLERLERLGLLSKAANGRLTSETSFLGTEGEIPSEVIRYFHRQILEKAMISLETQSVENRNFSSTIMTIAKKDLPKAKEMMRHFRRSLDVELSSGVEVDAVYCLGMQFFELSTGES